MMVVIMTLLLAGEMLRPRQTPTCHLQASAGRRDPCRRSRGNPRATATHSHQQALVYGESKPPPTAGVLDTSACSVKILFAGPQRRPRAFSSTRTEDMTGAAEQARHRTRPATILRTCSSVMVARHLTLLLSHCHSSPALLPHLLYRPSTLTPRTSTWSLASTA